MRAFEIYLNGQKLCIAGVNEDESLTADVCHAPGGAFLYVGGSTGTQGDHSKWINFKPLNVGDKVTIKIVETNAIDDPVVVDRGRLKKTSDS